MAQREPSISVYLDIDASAHELFRHVARPVDHSAIDGTGMLRGTDDLQVLSSVGDVFVMRMFNDEMGDYVMENHVVEFEPDRRIVWEPVLKTIDKLELQSDVGERAHHRWGWELSPQPDGATRVTAFFDLTDAPDWLHNATKEGENWRPGMQASLVNLAKLTSEPGSIERP